MRTRTCTHEKGSLNFLPPLFFSFSLPPSLLPRFRLLLVWGCRASALTNTIFWYLDITFSVLCKEKQALFRVFSPLWCNIAPYTYRGTAMKHAPLGTPISHWLLNKLGFSVQLSRIRLEKTRYCVIPLHFCSQDTSKTCNNA